MTMKERVLRKHPSMLLQRDIIELCSPSLKKLNYQMFNFIRVSDDNKLLYCCENRDWLYNHLINNRPSTGPFEQKKIPKKEQHILMDSIQEADSLKNDAKMFNIKFGITLVQPFESGINFFSFGTIDDDISTLNRVNSQIEELSLFTKMFFEKAKNIITKLSKQPFSPEDFTINYKPVIKDNRLYLGIDYDYNYLTRKEINLLQQLKDGSNAPQIAQLNKISIRTVEKHIEHIKHKLSCKTQYELGYVMAKLGIERFAMGGENC